MVSFGIYEDLSVGNDESFDSFISNLENSYINNDKGLINERIEELKSGEWERSILVKNYLKSFQTELLPNNILEKNKIPKDIFYSFLPISQFIAKNIKKIIEKFSHFFVDKNHIVLSFTTQINDHIKNKYIGDCFVDSFKNNSYEFDELLIRTNDLDFIENFFSQYPGLETVLSNSFRNIFSYVEEALNNLENNSLLIKQKFSLKDSKIKYIELFKSDLHHGNKFTIFITYNDGTILLYKPKLSKNESLFIQFLEKINEYYLIPYREYSILNIDDFSIVEFVKTCPCLSLQQVNEYFYNLGKYLFIFYVFESSDIIGDNILADGEIPCFIDLELLLSKSFIENMDQIFTSKIGLYFQKSVIKSGMLPRWSYGDINDKRDAIMGATFKVNSQKIKRAVWQNKNTRDMKQVESLEVFSDKPDSHLPLYNGEHVPIDSYMDTFKKGFRDVYLYFLNNKNLLKDVFNECFSETLMQRIILRDTSAYSILLKESYNVNILQKEGYFRDLIFEHLWAASSKSYFSKKFIYSEINQIRNGDIPFFYTYTDKNEILDKDNNVLVKNIFSKSSKENVYSKINLLSEEDLEIQLKIIDGTHCLYFESIKRQKFE